jgi:hypothetical protein
MMVAALVGSLATNVFLGYVVFGVLKRFLQLSIAASPLPLVEKKVLLEKTAPEVAERAQDRRPRDEVVPLDRAMGL